MDLAQTQYRIRQLLAIFRAEVELASTVGAGDINKYAETMLIPLFREIYGYTNLKNLNAEGSNFPGIDLGDENERVAFQITATSNAEKVKHTLEEFRTQEHYKNYDRVIIYILTQKQQSYSGRGFDEIIQQKFSFDKNRDIIDYRDVIEIVDTFPLDRARRVLAILEENFGSGVLDLPIISVHRQQDIGPAELVVDVPSTERNLQAITPENANALVKALTEYSARASAGQASQIDLGDHTIQAQVEVARQLVQESKYDAAYSILRKLQESEQLQQVSTEVRFNIANLLGCCALEAEDILAAQSYFDEAIELDPNNFKALVNASTTAVFAHNKERALELSSRARQQDPHNPLVLLAQLQALYAAGKYDEINELLADEPELAKDPRSAPILASIQFEAGNLDVAENLARKTVETAPNNIDHLVMLSSILIAAASSDITEDRTNPKLRREPLFSAERYLSKAVELAEQQNKSRQLQVALSNRAAVRYMLGKLEEGLIDADRVLASSAEDPNALQNKGRILMRMGRPQDAALCFDVLVKNAHESDDTEVRYVTIAGGSQLQDMRALLAEAYLQAGQPQKVKEILPALAEFTEGDETQLGELELLLITNEQLGDEPTTNKIIQKLEQDWLNSAIAKLILSGHWARHGDLAAAGRLLEQGLALARGRLIHVITLQLAHIRFQEGNYVEAASLFAPHIDTSYDNPDLRAYLIALYNSRQLSTALQLSTQLRTDLGPLAGISNIEVSILEEGGDHDNASKVLQDLINAGVDVLQNQTQLAQIEYRRLNLDDARQIVLNIPYRAVQNNARLLIDLARLRLLLDLPDVLKFAYQARRLDYANPEMHVRYMTLCLELHGPEADLLLQAPEEASLGTSVHVRRDDETTVFTILDEHPIFADRGELSKEDQLARELIGHRNGEQVVSSGSMSAHKYEIVEIQSKYLWANHESIYMFQSDKLRHPAFEVAHGTPERLVEQMFELLDRRSEHAPDIHDFYYKRGFPLSVVANLVKRSIVDIWLHFVESPGERLMSVGGSLEEYQADQEALSSSTDEIALDITSVLTVAELELEAMVVNRFERLLVAQGTIDELREYQHELSTRPPSAFAGGSGGQYYFTDVPPTYIKRRLTLVHKTLEFIQSHAQIVPTMGTMELDPVFVKNLGQSSAESLTLSKDRKCVFYSDDLHLRRLGWKEWQIPGFGTRTLLDDLKKRGMMSDSQYYAALRLLSQHNYSFLSMSADALIWTLENSAMSINEDVRLMFKSLTDPDCNPATVAMVLAEVIKRVWISPWMDYQKFAVVDLALNTLATGRRIAHVLPLLERALQGQFILIPWHLQFIRAVIRTWRQHRLA